MPVTVPRAAPAAVRSFLELIPPHKDVVARKLFGQPAAFVNGHMFFGVFGGDLFVRLPPHDRAEAKKTPGFRPFEPMPGRAMSEYMVLPPSIRRSRVQSRRWVDRALTYAWGLPPKATKR